MRIYQSPICHPEFNHVLNRKGNRQQNLSMTHRISLYQTGHEKKCAIEYIYETMENNKTNVCKHCTEKTIFVLHVINDQGNYATQKYLEKPGRKHNIHRTSKIYVISVTATGGLLGDTCSKIG